MIALRMNRAAKKARAAQEARAMQEAQEDPTTVARIARIERMQTMRRDQSYSWLAMCGDSKIEITLNFVRTALEEVE